MNDIFAFFRNLFDTEGWPARWHCGEWTGFHGWLYIISDLAIWGAYFAIPSILAAFVLRKKDVPFPRIFWLFGLFILACGTTHLVDALAFWWPAYRFNALVRFLTAVVSWGTVAALIPIVPVALALRTPGEMEAEIAERKQVENELRNLKDELERRVEERTAQLDATNQDLKRQIAERHRAEQELRDTAERLDLALKASNTGAWNWDLASGRLVWDERTHALFGLKPEMFKEKYEDFVSTLHADDRQRVEVEVRAAIQQHLDFDTEYRVVWSDGSVRHVTARGRAFYDQAGAPVRMSGVCLDITERKLAEEALREGQARLAGLVASAMDAIVSVDADQRVVMFNAAAERMFRCPAKEAIGQPIERFVPERFRAGHGAHISRFGETGVTSRSMGALGAISGLRADGDEFPIEASISQVKVGSQKLYTVILRDITERRRAEEEIRKLNEELEQRVATRTAELKAANKELESFAYSVSHDLRAPLRAMDGFALALSEDCQAKLDDRGKHYLGRIRSGAKQMAQLIEDLLALSRTARAEIRRERVNLSGLVEIITAELRRHEPERLVNVIIQPGVSGHGDRRLLRTVLENLLGNAWKFTSKLSRARIEFGAEARGAGKVYFIRDDGAGFDMAYVAKLFGVFQRLHSPGEFDGTGVGLASVQRIIHRHGGKVWANAVPQEGATFFFTLEQAADDAHG